MQFQMSPYVINTGALFDQFPHSRKYMLCFYRLAVCVIFYELYVSQNKLP